MRSVMLQINEYDDDDVCVGHTGKLRTNGTTKPINMPLGEGHSCGSKEPLLDGVQIPLRGTFEVLRAYVPADCNVTTH